MNKQMQPAVTGPVEPTVVQHTPGPWRLSAPGDICYVTGLDGQYILKRDSKKTWDKVAASRITADCRLIAAAPTMLDVLRRVDVSIVGCEANATSRKHWQEDMEAVKEMVRQTLRAAVGAA